MSLKQISNDNTHLALPLLIFDGKCPFCQRFAKGLQSLAGNIRLTIIDLNNLDLYRQFPELNLEDCSKHPHLIDEEFRIYKGIEIKDYLTQHIPAAKKLSWLLESSAGNKASKYFYDYLQRTLSQKIHRSGGCHHC